MSNGLSKDGKNFVEGIVTFLRRDGKKTTLIPKAQTLLSKISKSVKEEKVAYVESVVPLTSEEKAYIEKTIRDMVGHEIMVSTMINKSLIAGLRIKIADFIIDTSYSSKLSEMAVLLTRQLL